MEYKTYLARKRLKKLVICGHVNIPLRHYQPRCL